MASAATAAAATPKPSPFKTLLEALPKIANKTETGTGLATILLRIQGHLVYLIRLLAKEPALASDTEQDLTDERTHALGHAKNFVVDTTVLSKTTAKVITDYQQLLHLFDTEFAGWTLEDRKANTTALLNTTAAVAAALDFELAGITNVDIGYSV